MPARAAEAAFAKLWVWEHVGDRLPWYLDVACNRRPAKYLISRRVACSLPLQTASEEDMWAEHARLTEEFLRLWASVKAGDLEITARPPAGVSLVDLSAELAGRMLAHCTFCRWDCGVNRLEGRRHGTCQLESPSRVGSFFHHRGEELVFRGTQGSGTVFFTSCNLRCQFCQNGDISHDKENGTEMTPEVLAAAAWQLRLEGCHNINFVGGEPTIHLHTILAAIQRLARNEPPARADLVRAQGAKSDAYTDFPWDLEKASYRGEFNAPMLWNSNFFMSDLALRLLRPLFDVWLPDFKFGSDKCAVALARTPWYFETVASNHQKAYDWGEDMVIRHLVMPEHVECCTEPVLEWIAKHTPKALVNVMDQYHPDLACDPASERFAEKYRALSRRPRPDEVRRAYAYAEDLGLRWREVSLEKSVLGVAGLPFAARAL